MQAQSDQIDCVFVRTVANLDYTCQLSNIVVNNDEQENIIIGGDHLPGQSNADVFSVRILNSEIPSILTQIFTIFPNIERLEITRGGLTQIQPGAFVDAKNLKRLIITQNSLDELLPAAFVGATNLIELDLRSNTIGFLRPNAFIGLRQLTDLHLGFNHIRELPDNIFRPLIGLINIFLNFNRLERLHAKDFSHNSRLLRLRFPNNRIYAIERELFTESLPEAILFNFDHNVCAYTGFLFMPIEWILNHMRVCIENFERIEENVLD